MNGMGPVLAIVAVGVVIFVVCIAGSAIQANARHRRRWRIRHGADLVEVFDDGAAALEGSRR